jgi:ABC-type bacteriocin/lantibiotic exporter with double-glycine peptidase domain
MQENQMKYVPLLLLAAMLTVPFDFKNPKPEHPVMNLPPSLRQGNWSQSGEGSCVVASMVSLLRWQGRGATANKLKRKYGGGQSFSEWNETLNSEGIRYAATRKENNISFLEKAIATRRGCMVTVMGEAHMICLVDLTQKAACLLDNNNPGSYKWVSRKDFLDEWRRANSWALTPIYTPTSPRIQ